MPCIIPASQRVLQTLHVHPVHVAEGGDPAVHVVLQVEELGVSQLPELPQLQPGLQGARGGCGALAEDVIKPIVHRLGLQISK